MNKTTRNQKVVDEMINSISKEKILYQVLSGNKIAEIETINEIHHYKRDGDRRGLIVELQEKNSDARSKIMIDVKLGEPIINQVYDSVYDIGKDCSKRIVIYLNGQNDFDEGIPAADYWVVNSLINNLQQYPLGIHFLEMNGGTFAVGPHFMHEYFESDQKYSISDVPNKEQFMTETFWGVYFDSFNEGFYNSQETFRGRFKDTSDWGYIIYIDCSFYGEIQLHWDQKGVRYLVIQKTDDDEYLKKVLDFEMPGLKKRYGSDAVEFENAVGKLPRLHIKYSDRPFDWLYTATPRQITEFANAMYEDAWALRWRIEERIDGLIKRN